MKALLAVVLAVAVTNPSPSVIDPGRIPGARIPFDSALGDWMPGDKAVKALEAWVKTYRAGKVEVTMPANKGGQGADVGGFVADKELEVLLGAVTKLDTGEAMIAVLEVASIGLDDGKYSHQMAPYQVRYLAEKHLTDFKSEPAMADLAKAARGEIKNGDKARTAALRAAAVRAIGICKQPSLQSVITQNLAANEEVVRVAAAEGCELLVTKKRAAGEKQKHEREGIVAEAALDNREVDPSFPAEQVDPLIEALAASLGTETSDPGIVAKVGALRATYRYLLDKAGKAKPAAEKSPAEKPPAEKPPAEAGKEAGKGDAAGAAPASAPAAAAQPDLPQSAMLAARAAISALGKASWRADLMLVNFLDEYRSPETVPALIDVLARFKEKPELVQSGKLSTLLKHRVHEVLVSMTGAVFPAEAIDKWREFWEKEKATLKVVTRSKEPKKVGDTVASSLFGIPVQGSRVLFVVDLSRSMTFEMNPEFKLPSGKRPQRIELAKEALTKVINEMPETTKFNFITYNGNPKADAWNKDMVVANPENKKKARDFVEKFRPDGGTNMWAGLEEGLKMKSLVYGDRYETNVDEMFIVSDGAPSVGDVVDAQEILNLVTETNRFSKVRINTIFMTSENEEEKTIARQGGRKQSLLPDELMEKMAKQNGGTFKNIGKK